MSRKGQIRDNVLSEANRRFCGSPATSSRAVWRYREVSVASWCFASCRLDQYRASMYLDGLRTRILPAKVVSFSCVRCC